jgi:hypothetical protein
MAVSDLHRRVALTALAVAGRYGFALGGGNALIAHGVGHQPRPMNGIAVAVMVRNCTFASSGSEAI